MATPAVAVDGSSVVNAATTNKYLASDGTKIQVKVYHARLQYDGSDFIVVDATTTDNAGLVTGDLSYNAGTDVLEITIAGFSNPPVAIATKSLGATNYNVSAIAVNDTQVNVEFYAVADGSKITGGEDTSMDFQILIIGF